MLPASFWPATAPDRSIWIASSLLKTAVMMKKISRLRTKSSIGARSMPVVSSEWKCRRSRISEPQLVREPLGLAPGARSEVEDGVEAGDADGEAGERADHRVGDAARHGAGVGGA